MSKYCGIARSDRNGRHGSLINSESNKFIIQGLKVNAMHTCDAGCGRYRIGNRKFRELAHRASWVKAIRRNIFSFVRHFWSERSHFASLDWPQKRAEGLHRLWRPIALEA